MLMWRGSPGPEREVPVDMLPSLCDYWSGSAQLLLGRWLAMTSSAVGEAQVRAWA